MRSRASNHHFPRLKGKRVLIVEDEMMVAMDLEDLLTEQGCIMLESACTIGQALARIEEDQPELVILDRNLDGTRTTPVAEELNSCGIPYVVLTGYTHGVADEPAMASAPCLQKPWDTRELMRQLSRLAGQAG